MSTVKPLAIRGLAFTIKMNTEQLARNQKKIRGAHQEIPSPETFRFAAEAEKPFQASILHPSWRLPQCARKERERRADRDNRHLQAMPKFISPDLLPGAAQTHKDDLSAGLADLVGDPVCNLRTRSAEGRRLGARNYQVGESLLEIHAHL